MPGFIAKKLCPNLVIVPPNYHKYHEESKKVKEVLSQYDPNFCPMGLDESYLDLTDIINRKVRENGGRKTSVRETSRSSFESPPSPDMFTLDNEDMLSPYHWLCAEHMVKEIRAGIYERTSGLTASAGIAPNKMLAKIASDINKPDGQYLVEPTREGVLNFMQNLPIRKVPLE